MPRPARARILPRSFYLPSPEVVAPALLGKVLVRPSAGLSGRIIEVEAYFGEGDPAAHSFGGKTQRNAVLFGPPGHAYVYFIYGMHFCLNVSCEPDGRAGGVLFRALQPLTGLDLMSELRRKAAKTSGHVALSALASGPGRLCQAFGITRERDNGIDFTAKNSDLQIQDDGFVPEEVLVTPRVGITKASDRQARFLLGGKS